MHKLHLQIKHKVPILMYLLEETTEAENLRQKVCNLLLSQEENNIKLAYQLIESGGMHRNFIVPFWVLYLLHRGYSHKWKTFMEMFFSKKQVSYNELCTICIMGNDGYDECLEHILRASEENSLGEYKFQIVSLFFQTTGWGRKTCFLYNLFPPAYIFSHSIPTDLLDLKDFQLENLPIELATTKTKKLDLRGNSFSQIQKHDWVNTFVEVIDLDIDVKKKVMKHMAKCFPNAIAKSFQDLACGAVYHNKDNKQAVAFLRAIPLKYRHLGHYGDRARYALEAGYAHTALVFQEYEEKKYGIIYNLVRAYAYAILKQKTKMVNFLAKGIMDIYSFNDEDIEKMKIEYDVRLEGYNGQVRKNRFFDSYKDDEDVQGLINARISMNDANFVAYLQETLGKFPICTQIFPENRFRSFAKYAFRNEL